MVTTLDLYALTEIPIDHPSFGAPSDEVVRAWEHGGGDVDRLLDAWYISAADLLAGERNPLKK